MVSDQEEEMLDSPLSPANDLVETSPDGTYSRVILTQFEEVLGRGSTKIVFRALNNYLGNEVAWNVVSLDSLQPSDRRLLFEEVQLAQSLEHPNILRYLDAWVNHATHQLIIITELMSGGSLWTYITKKIKQPRLSMIRYWCLDILRGLEYLHTHQPFPIIHRDLKCNNVFVRAESGQLVIGDFGFSKVMQTPLAATVLGTCEFMAPEVLEGSYGLSADIYAFGMCIIEMTTAQKPYRECPHFACVYGKILNHSPPQALSQIPDPALQHIVEQCIGPASDRPSASQLLQHPFFQTSPGTPRTTTLVPISLTLCGLNGKKTLVSFDYDTMSDTPERVSYEMVEQLKLDESLVQPLSTEIARRLSPVLPATHLAAPTNSPCMHPASSQTCGRSSMEGSPRNQCRVLSRNQSHENLHSLTHVHYDKEQKVVSPATFSQANTAGSFVWGI